MKNQSEACRYWLTLADHRGSAAVKAYRLDSEPTLTDMFSIGKAVGYELEARTYRVLALESFLRWGLS